ncbi:MAG TPA: hypothetical protein VFI71_00230, partial [Pyrinomonadaceae bacterium]|nr:hypothetical protein [Pyrinomonadaceae bacterium]
MFKKISPAKAQSRKEKPFKTRQRFASLRLCGSIFLFLLCLSSCKREERQFSSPPSTFKSYDVTMSDLHPGSPGMPQPVKNPSDERA